MNKPLKISLISFLMLIILLSGILFTQAGNNLLKPFLKTELEKQIGLPVKIDIFKLRYDHIKLNILIDNALNVNIYSLFNLLTLSFNGNYKIDANHFIYDEVNIKQANINGIFKGVPTDLLVNGQGTSFDAPLKYNVHIKDGDAKEITFYMKDMPITEIFAITKQPALAQGKVDANLTIPTLIGNSRHADLKLLFTDLTFNDDLIKKVYKISIPSAMIVQGDIDAHLTGNDIAGSVDMKSNVANLNLQNVKFNTQSRQITSDYIVDILDLKSFSELLHTKVNGILLLQGHIEKTKTLKVTGFTKSLGGEINYTLLNKMLTASLEKIPMQNMLKLFSFPPFVDANTTGKIHYDLINRKGQTSLALENFKLAPNSITENLGRIMPMNPSDIVFGNTSLDAQIDGDEVIYNLIANASQASLNVNEGKINRASNTHNAKIAFGFNTYTINGTVNGSIRKPNIAFDTKSFLQSQMLNEDFSNKAEKEVRRFFKRLF